MMKLLQTRKSADPAQSLCRLVAVLAFLLLQLPAARAQVPPVAIAASPLPGMSGGMGGGALDNAAMQGGSASHYRAGYDAAGWVGSLVKRQLSAGNGGGVAAAALADWDAGAILTGENGSAPLPPAQRRRIYTADVSRGHAAGVVEFRWNDLSPVQQQWLDRSPVSGAADGLGARRVAYLRGDRVDEQGQPQGIFRARTRVLGDIVNSNVVHVGAPAAHIQGSTYRQFRQTWMSRPAAVYVGANDGMLHAFDAGSGEELFAYVPDVLLPDLNQLAGPGYAHRPYADGMIAVAEAHVRGQWKTVLAAGLGGGAQAVVALDVTDPAYFASGLGALWEFTDADDADLGNVMGMPQIAMFRIGMQQGAPVFRHFVVVAAGLNNYVDDGRFNAQAPAVLFLLALDKAPNDRWQLGVNYFKFSKPVQDAALPNGLSAPALVRDHEDAVRYAYAADLQGNLWRFDFTSDMPWARENRTMLPLYTARDDLGRRQPVTVQPRVVHAPGGGYVILFGTGKFVEAADLQPGGYATQSFYAIYDSTRPGHAVAGRSELAQRTLSPGAGGLLNFSGDAFMYGDGTGRMRGWYFDFHDSRSSGERSVSSPVTEAGRLLFNTLMPCPPPCAQGGGRSYVVDALSGMPVTRDATGLLSHIGMLAPPLTLQVASANAGSNALGRASVTRKSVVIQAGSGGSMGELAVGRGDADGGLVETALAAMRLSWREILNWQELRAAVLSP